jgi:hypothetical protein
MPPRPAIDSLPQEVRDEFNARLVANKFQDYSGMADWLASQGYDISRAAVGRAGKALKDQIDRAYARALQRVECAKAMRGLSDDDKAALMEANEMVAMDELLDLLDDLKTLDDPALRAKHVPPIIKAAATLHDSARGTARWRAEFEAKVRAEERAKAAEAAEKAAKTQGVSAETIAIIRRDVLGMPA